MSDEVKKIRVAAVADLHVKAIDKGKFADYFRDISKKADVLLIGGDLTDTGDEAEANVLAEEMKSCSIPIAAVLGNHDHEKGRHKIIRQILQSDHVHILDGEIFTIENIGIAGIKGFGGGFDTHMLSMFGEEAMKAFVREAVNEALSLDRALSRLDQEFEHYKKIVLMHYSPVKCTVVGEPEAVYPFLGCSRLAEPLNRQEIVAVFHGHAHRGVFEGCNIAGVKIFNVSWTVLQKAGFEIPVFIMEV